MDGEVSGRGRGPGHLGWLGRLLGGRMVHVGVPEGAGIKEAQRVDGEVGSMDGSLLGWLSRANMGRDIPLQQVSTGACTVRTVRTHVHDPCG